MRFLRKGRSWEWVYMLLVLSCQSLPSSPSFPVSTLTSWNEQLMSVAVAEDGLLTLKGLRTTAMMQLAVHDVLNSIEPRYAAYAFQLATPEAQPLPAAAMAAYVIAQSQYPDQDSLWGSWLPHHADTVSIRLGRAAAAAVLAEREGDGWDGEAEYSWHPMAPGVYAEFNEHSGTPEGFIFGSGWARAQPFMLPTPDHFRAPPPPAIESQAYTEAFEEVKSAGAQHSETRTADQAHLAMWWKDFVENSHNRLARKLVREQALDLWESARLFALMNTTIYDAYVNVFDNKFHYNHWRPYTAIRWAEHDGNPDTEPDPNWTNLHKHTYAFPSYPSAHGTASSAAMTVLAHALGTGDDFAFTMTTEAVDKAGPFSGKVQMNPPTRSFNSFSEAGMEASMSRVYLGIHFRYDSEEGHKLGTKIGAYAASNFLPAL